MGDFLHSLLWGTVALAGLAFAGIGVLLYLTTSLPTT